MMQFFNHIISYKNGGKEMFEQEVLELTEQEMVEINGGAIAQWAPYGGALLAGWFVGHTMGYVFA